MPEGAGGLVGRRWCLNTNGKTGEQSVGDGDGIAHRPGDDIAERHPGGEARLVALSNTPFVTVAGQDSVICWPARVIPNRVVCAAAGGTPAHSASASNPL